MPVIIPAGAARGVYRFEARSGPAVGFQVAGAPLAYTIGQPGRLTVLPEPSVTGLCLSAAPLLRRRRGTAPHGARPDQRK